jgi:hypothetical protein
VLADWLSEIYTKSASSPGPLKSEVQHTN